MTKYKALMVPDWMIPAECSVRTQKHGTTHISVAMNTTRAEKPVLYSIDGQGWDHTPFQTAELRHRLDNSVVNKVWSWIGSIAA